MKDRTSFFRRLLADLEYDKEDTREIERLMNELNGNAINKSVVLKNLTLHLKQLNQSLERAGNVEITPFSKKMQDLAKHFSVYFGESTGETFPIEYHGMVTRSWASMLTVKAFIQAQREKYEKKGELFFPILAAEEPEAHLHPNAQKTLYQQLADIDGQVIVSTHSPYLAAMADLSEIRSIRNDSTGITVKNIDQKIFSEDTSEDKRKLARKIIERGEILFARALILGEGVSEEQIIPALWDLYYPDKSLFSSGICCIEVGGITKYPPFIKLAYSLGIPTFIISDNDGSTEKGVGQQLRKLKAGGYQLDEEIFGISYLKPGNCLEKELLKETNLREEIIEMLSSLAINAIENPQHRKAKLEEKEIRDLTDEDLLKKMKNNKFLHSALLADVIRKNPNNKPAADIIPAAIIPAFDQIKEWLKL